MNSNVKTYFQIKKLENVIKKLKLLEIYIRLGINEKFRNQTVSSMEIKMNSSTPVDLKINVVGNVLNKKVA